MGEFDHKWDFGTSVDSNNIHAHYYPEFYDQQNLVDPALQSPHMPDVSSPYVQAGTTAYHTSYYP